MPVLDSSSAADIERAARLLADGELLGLPTETVYGLAARADDDAAALRIFRTKGRPSGHPLIVHVADIQAAHAFVPEGWLEQLPDYAAALMRAFWPGPLTVITPRRAGMAEVAAGAHPTVGLRCPAHPQAQAVLRAALHLGVPGVAAPSANAFGRISPTTAAHVLGDFPELPVLDGGACSVGVESTIIDCTRPQPVLLRPGAITPEHIVERTHIRVQLPDAQAHQANRTASPGTLAAHYAPRAKLRLMGAKDIQAALDMLGRDAPPLAVWSRSKVTSSAPRVHLHTMPAHADAAAHALFAQLRAFDALGVGLIWVEPVPPTPEWAAVADRLQRAAAA